MSVKVRNNQARMQRIEGVTFAPGLNSVAEDNWKRIQKHPIGKQKIEKGLLEEVQAKGKEQSATELAKEIPEIYDMVRLQELAEDSRSTVAQAAQKQIDKINAASGDQ